MTYPGSHLLVSWLFSVMGTDEVAVTSLRCTNPSDPFAFMAVDAQAQVTSATLTALATAMKNLLTGPSFQWGSYSQIVGMKVASIGPTGHYITDPAVGDVIPTMPGASNIPAPHDSVVITLDSGTSFGHATKGRMYLPHCRNATATTGSPFMGGVTTMLAAARVFLGAVRTTLIALPGAPEPAILSSFGAGTANRIIQLSMDNVLDTQRRRKEQLKATRSFLPFP